MGFFLLFVELNILSKPCLICLVSFLGCTSAGCTEFFHFQASGRHATYVTWPSLTKYLLITSALIIQLERSCRLKNLLCALFWLPYILWVFRPMCYTLPNVHSVHHAEQLRTVRQATIMSPEIYFTALLLSLLGYSGVGTTHIVHYGRVVKIERSVFTLFSRRLRLEPFSCAELIS